MANNNNKDISYLQNKRGRDNNNYNETFNLDRQDNNADSNIPLLRRTDDFIAPINLSHNFTSNNNSNFFRREQSNLPNTIGLNESQNTLLHQQSSNFFPTDTSKSPIVPNTGFVSYYPFKENKNNNTSNANLFQNLASPNRSVTNSKSLDGGEYSSSENVTTPSQNYHENNAIHLPDTCAPKLQNIVSTVNLKCTLDLRDIALKTKNSEYNPKRFAAVIMRIREPKTTSLIFASGKMVCTGARSEEDSRKASRHYAKIIQKLGYQVKFSEFKIQNIVGSCDVKFPIRLEGLYNAHSKFCSYEPEMFPGLIYKMGDPKIVLLIFVSGKIVLTGAKDRHDIYRAFQNIYPVLINFKKTITNQIFTNNVNETPNNNIVSNQKNQQNESTKAETTE